LSVFGQTYASAYDHLYDEKDYVGECDMIEALITADGAEPRRLLDLGCGTGNHAIPLARRGYTVAGVDISEAMLARAREKAAALGAAAKTAFYRGDVRTFRLNAQNFDAALMMFAVLGYQQTDEDVAAALDTARAHLVPGASFVFDVWYGPGVIADKPGPRNRVVEKGADRIMRQTNTEIDESRHLCSVRFDVDVWQNGVQTARTREEHIMRYFFPDELEKFARASGFTLVTLRCFPNWKEPIVSSSWNAVGMLRAI